MGSHSKLRTFGAVIGRAPDICDGVVIVGRGREGLQGGDSKSRTPGPFLPRMVSLFSFTGLPLLQ
uniref:Uncharacterized protein n=1 Tax=Physcomitrium patens TaxID=3218 RepID=A0A2K1K3M7_PHYPA|nr:hypothetical protein PHYPA_012857 [Physcomitrium patens]